jgi:hypothetical protein
VFGKRDDPLMTPAQGWDQRYSNYRPKEAQSVWYHCGWDGRLLVPTCPNLLWLRLCNPTPSSPSLRRICDHAHILFAVQALPPYPFGSRSAPLSRASQPHLCQPVSRQPALIPSPLVRGSHSFPYSGTDTVPMTRERCSGAQLGCGWMGAATNTVYDCTPAGDKFPADVPRRPLRRPSSVLEVVGARSVPHICYPRTATTDDLAL